MTEKAPDIPIEYAIADCVEFLDSFLQDICHECCLDNEGDTCWLWRGGHKAGKRPYAYLGLLDSVGIDGSGLHALGVIASGPPNHAGLPGDPTPLPRSVYPFFVHEQLFHPHFTLIAPGSAIGPHQGAQSWHVRTVGPSAANKPFNLALVDERNYWDLALEEWESRWGRLEMARVKNAWQANCAEKYRLQIQTGTLHRQANLRPDFLDTGKTAK